MTRTPRRGTRRAGNALSSRIGLGTLAVLSALVAPSIAEDTPLSLGDLEAYRIALASKPDPGAPRVGFRDLWDHADSYVGRPVRVEGKVRRVFQQAGLGEFPPLAEVWIVSEGDNPFCLVFPIPKGGTLPAVDRSVRFSGTFLKRLKYQGGDVARVTPLIVGPEAPATVGTPAGNWGTPSWSTVDWILGLGAVSMVAMMLARRHLARPVPEAAPVDPPPVFVDGEGDRLANDPDPGGATDEPAR